MKTNPVIITAPNVPVKETPPNTMLDPATDDSQRDWCYIAKSTIVIGVPFQPGVTQVTYDGALYTTYAELCFAVGQPLRPLLARQKTFFNGWIPIVQYGWTEAALEYSVEMFAFPLEEEDETNTVNFTRLRVRNVGSQKTAATLRVAMRHTGKDARLAVVPSVTHRVPAWPFDPSWEYVMADDAVYRDGKLIYIYSGGGQRESVTGTPYRNSFTGADLAITEQTAVCAVRYERELVPGEEFSVDFKMPRVPVERSAAAFISKLQAADYVRYRARVIKYWEEMVTARVEFSVPEKRVDDSLKASLVHTLLATRTRDGRRMQTDGIPYPDFFLTATPQEGLLYLTLGHPEFARDIIVRPAIAQQEPDGLYLDRSLAHGKKIPAAHGHVLFIAIQTALYEQDRAMGAEIFASVSRAIQYLAQATQTDAFGLLPPATPYDNEMITGHYASNNFWALHGLRQAVRLARFLGRTQIAQEWTEFEQKYRQNILRGLAVSAQEDGYIPPGLHPYRTGRETAPDCDEYRTGCDWENMLLAYPGELLPPSDRRVRATVERIRTGYAEGIMTYRHGQHLHQYITANIAEQYLVLGDSVAALKDFYHILLHAGSAHECFENLIIPWTDRHVRPDCPPPHAWASSILGLFIRNLLVMEYGGLAGLELGQRELWLFHCLAPAWVSPGQEVAVRNAPTEFGVINATMKFHPRGAIGSFRSQFHEPPAAFRLRIPYFKTLIGFKTDAATSRQEGDCLVLSPDATTVTIEWEEKPNVHSGVFQDLLLAYRGTNQFKGVAANGWPVIERQTPFLTDQEKQMEPAPLTFELVVQAFRHEYARRAEACRQSGGRLVTVEAPG